jgi:hypothetical protein
MRRAIAAFACAILFLSAMLSTAIAVEIRKAGSLTLPSNMPVMPFSTDPTIAEVLGQDLGADRRGVSNDAGSPLTLTVSVSQQPLEPGVSLSQLAPGDPQVADLIRAAGATPPPIGDTGDKPDEAAIARARAQRMMAPHDNPMQQLINQFEAPSGGFGSSMPCDPGSYGPGCAPAPQPTARPAPGDPDFTGDTQQYMRQGSTVQRFKTHDDKSYQTVIVARVTLTGETGELTVVGVTQPGEDLHDAKKLIAENIANAVLH